jgi:tetratricopeptide (TPR) repeat protein
MSMSMKIRRSVSFLLLFGSVLTACNLSQETPPATQPPASPPPQAVPPPPPQPQRLVLYVVPLNPNDFSMEAIQANKKKIEQHPDDVQALVSLADANFMIQRFEVAKGYYERALKADQKHVNARIMLSNSYIFLQNPEEAIHQLDELLKTQKDYPEALFNKGLILMKAKQDMAGAKQTWARLVESHPEHQLAQQVKGELEQL